MLRCLLVTLLPGQREGETRYISLSQLGLLRCLTFIVARVSRNASQLCQYITVHSLWSCS